MFSLENKLAVVTGAGSGIGQAIAVLFAQQGARVVVVELSEQAGAQTREQIAALGRSAHVYGCDVSVAAQVERTFAAIAADHGEVDILVNNAGISHIGTVLTTDEE